MSTDERLEGIWFWFKVENRKCRGSLKSSCMTNCMSPQPKRTTVRQITRGTYSNLYYPVLNNWLDAKCHGKVYPSCIYRIACQKVKTPATG